jgi:hypothetical protein
VGEKNENTVILFLSSRNNMWRYAHGSAAQDGAQRRGIVKTDMEVPEKVGNL